MTIEFKAAPGDSADMTDTQRNERSVVWTLLHELAGAGYLPGFYDDGGDSWETIKAPFVNGKLQEAFDAIYGVDECVVRFMSNDTTATAFFVLGNAPWEVVNDWSDKPGFADIIRRVTDAAEAMA